MCATRKQSGQPPLMRPSRHLTLLRPMVCTHSMVRTSKTSTPYSLYTVTWEELQPGADEAQQVNVEFHPYPPLDHSGPGKAQAHSAACGGAPTPATCTSKSPV